MMSRGGAQRIGIRDLKSIDDLSQMKAVEKEVWGMADEDSFPLTLAIACKAAGNIFVGAFDKDKDNDKDKLVGFAFGFLGRANGQTTIHSHLLAVLAAYRHLDLGSRLKQAQRERAMAMGVREMTWTYDPLQSRNAHFNFSKLGVVSDAYKVDFYGPETSSMLHRNGTDRLWVRWMLNSRRVRDRLAGKSTSKTTSTSTTARVEALDALRLLTPLVRFDPSGKPGRADLAESLARQRVSIEIPGDILEVERTDMGLAREWRDATRWAFREAIKAGFFVSEYCRSVRGQQGPGAYLLQRGAVSELIPEA
ncbi:MAG: GNAT family N-acetyltransferase [Terriglobales bacterium]|jgi:predicted GNAT superfamily acetyltransferase